jgi:hypothetical protein
MKRLISVVLAVVLLVSLTPAIALAGNGLPEGVNGYHFTLNIIGVQNAKKADMDASGGSTIFVNLEGKSKIYLQEYVPEVGEEMNFKDAFAVLDKNACDSDGALFQLPAPGFDAYVIGVDPSPETIYSVFARPLGKPGGWSTITTCATVDEASQNAIIGMVGNGEYKKIMNAMEDGAFCSVEQVGQAITERKTGKSEFQNVTAQLTSIVFQINLYTEEGGALLATYYVRVPVFDELLENEFWLYDNNNLKHLQLRFYEVPTSLVDADAPYAPIIVPQ